jgi:hypothetical protein
LSTWIGIPGTSPSVWGAASDGAQSWRWRQLSPFTTSSDTDEEREEPNVT